MTARMFLTVDVMSAASGFLMTDMAAVYQVCEFAAGEPVWTHQLPRVGAELKASLLSKTPSLIHEFEYIKATCTPETYKDVAAELERRIGLSIEIEPMTFDEHERIDPHSELVEKVHPDRIITIKTNPER